MSHCWWIIDKQRKRHVALGSTKALSIFYASSKYFLGLFSRADTVPQYSIPKYHHERSGLPGVPTHV